jgi:glycosyltransferase involved in cell wall biosynthesis
MTTIHFDDIIFSLQSFGGASVYWQEVTARVDRDPRFRTRHHRPSRWARGVPSLSKADVFHSSHFRTHVSRRCRVVSTVHDMNYELGYVQPGAKATINVLERKLSYFTADALICISESTRRELLEVYPALAGRCPIHVVHHGFTPLAATPEDAGAPSAGRYVLYVGARGGYKRFDDCLEGFHLSGLWRDGTRLLCTGSPFNDAETACIAALGLTDHVSAVGKVSSSRLAHLYRHAHCLVYCSTHEGFGLPLLEAMHCGCPVVACNTSCMPEITGDAALLVQPESPGDISRALCDIDARRADLVARGHARLDAFSWDKSAEKHMNIYLDIEPSP